MPPTGEVKTSWPIMRYKSGIGLERLKNPTKKSEQPISQFEI
jgi:hypothetical protein